MPGLRDCASRGSTMSVRPAAYRASVPSAEADALVLTATRQYRGQKRSCQARRHPKSCGHDTSDADVMTTITARGDSSVRVMFCRKDADVNVSQARAIPPSSLPKSSAPVRSVFLQRNGRELSKSMISSTRRAITLAHCCGKFVGDQYRRRLHRGYRYGCSVDHPDLLRAQFDPEDLLPGLISSARDYNPTAKLRHLPHQRRARTLAVGE